MHTKESCNCAVLDAGLEGSHKFMPVERELVFDIDLTDYDDVRTCGKGAHICNKCWPLMAIAIKVVIKAQQRVNILLQPVACQERLAGCQPSLA